MVLPITYPAATTVGLNADVIGSYKHYKKGARQSRPYNLPLEYHKEVHWTEGAVLNTSNYLIGIRNRMAGFSPEGLRSQALAANDVRFLELQSRLRGKLESEFRVTAELAVTIAEGKQAFDMIINRVMQLVRFGISLKKGHFYLAARELGILRDPSWNRLDKSQKLRRGAKHFGNNYLEFHFGWSPLVKDIGDAMDVLSSDVPTNYYEVRSGVPESISSYTSTFSLNVSSAKSRVLLFGKAGVGVRVINPNLYLASNMGLTSPASVLWELVPFSFVVDWFWNVGQFLKSFSDLYGVEWEEPWYLLGARYHTITNYKYRARTSSPWVYPIIDLSSHTLSIHRLRGLPSIHLYRKRVPLFGGNPRRALAAISLLIQQGLGYR